MHQTPHRHHRGVAAPGDALPPPTRAALNGGMSGITIAVLGSGPVACDIARSRVEVGHLVRMYTPGEAALSEAQRLLREEAQRLPADEGQRLLNSVLLTTDLQHALDGAAVVIDARDR
jgi:hypothetical protein